jgi:small ligand-binding sensory domain FIST
VSVAVGAGISTEHDPLQAAVAAAGTARSQLSGAPVDLALVFASGSHLAAPEATLEGIHSALAPNALIGCGAAGVLGEGRELESGNAVAVWGAAFRGSGEATPFHAAVSELAGEHHLDGMPPLERCSGAILLSEPYSFPTDAVLAALASEAPAVPVIGGLSSARTPEGEGALFFGERVVEQGAVGVAFEGVEMLPCVSQGAVPVGREMTITAAEGNVIHALAGRPALEMVELIIAELPPGDRALVASGLLLGIVIEPGKPEYEQGDFLVRGVIGADSDSGSLVVGASVRPGQVVRLHARDASSADEDLRRVLRLHLASLAGRPPAGALLFSCNGRGSAMFSAPDHDAAAVKRELNGAPAAGFFAAGEIGPVGTRSFLHGFTATLALFPSER